MELEDKAKEAARQLGDAINSAIGTSTDVGDAIEHLHEIGYDPHLTLKLEIALARADEEQPRESLELELTEDDIRTLQRMNISSR